MKNYNEILEKHASKDKHRIFITKPFLLNGKACATDAYRMIWVDEKLTSGYEKLKENINIENVIPNPNCNIKLDVKEIREAIEKAPLVDEMIDDTEECKECDGFGEVEWEYGGYTNDFDCPVCDGDGTIGSMIPSGNKVIDDLCFIDFGNIRVKISLIADFINFISDDLYLIYKDKPNNPLLFKSSDLTFLIMPHMQTENNNVIHKINL